MNSPKRIKIEACIHPETYQYFFEADEAQSVWARLEQHYGPIKKNSFDVQWIECKALMFKSPLRGSPITVLRKRFSTGKDIKNLHYLIGYQGQI